MTCVPLKESSFLVEFSSTLGFFWFCIEHEIFHYVLTLVLVFWPGLKSLLDTIIDHRKDATAIPKSEGLVTVKGQ